MKHLNKFLLAVIMVMAMSTYAQNDNNPWALSFGVNAVTMQTSTDLEKNWLDKNFSQMYNINRNWNTLPSVSYIGLAKSVGDNFSVGVQGSINKISKIEKFDPNAPGHDSSGNVVVNPGDLMYYGIDASVKYSFMSLFASKTTDPSLSVGGGYAFLGDESFGTVNIGGGLTFWLTEHIGLALTTSYKEALREKTNSNVRSHFQHTLGLAIQFGGKDTDGDGIYDKHDACPEVAGLKQFNGCPDTDGDGIIDGSDACPTEFGKAELNGCPDKDGDGIADKDDACPDTAGLAAFQGCPDTDRDGVTDASDKCPTVKGPKDNAGCPWPDTDGDSVLDKDDKCPDVKGTVANNGCPEVTIEALENIKIQARSVFFNSGESTFKEGDTPTRLDAIKEILKNYPTAKFSVEGHTDSDGSDKFNQKLSEARANAVRNAMVERGINADNLTAVGFGESQPIASNKTKAGKAENRRTEVKHVGSK